MSYKKHIDPTPSMVSQRRSVSVQHPYRWYTRYGGCSRQVIGDR